MSSSCTYGALIFVHRTMSLFWQLYNNHCYLRCKVVTQYKSESIRKLYVAYNNVFRLLCNEPRYCSASYMFVTRGLPTCKMLIRKKVYSFMMCIAKSSYTILQSILNSDALYTSQMYQHWRSVLYLYHF